ncbi:MAG: fatty acid desaturase DesE [Bdellovibrio sp.]
MNSSNLQKQDPKMWKKIVRPYMEVDHKKSWMQMANTLIPLVGMWYLTYRSLEISYLLTLALSFVTSFFFVRAFIIMHDCGHGTFFKTRKMRDFVGTILGVINFTPYHQWTKEHATHHNTSGNLDKRGHGDVWTMTVEEYNKATLFEKFQYRLYRNPLVTFVIGPIYIFQFRHRIFLKHDTAKERKSVVLTNILLVLSIWGLSSLVGFKNFLLVQVPILFIAQTVGCWLFYVQHQYENVYWGKGEKWSYVEAALKGCSFYKLPKILQWGTGNIGFHHIHHLSHLIPNYNLEKAYRENELFQNAPVLTFWMSFRCASLKLYDEDKGDLISFREYKKRFITAKKAALAVA